MGVPPESFPGELERMGRVAYTNNMSTAAFWALTQGGKHTVTWSCETLRASTSSWVTAVAVSTRGRKWTNSAQKSQSLSKSLE